MSASSKFLYFFLLMWLTAGCHTSAQEEEKETAPDPYQDWKSLSVTASAYNALETQGMGNPRITAWGDTLKSETKSIAVSRDLIAQGLTHGTPVKIEGFEELFVVNDKMHPRWKNKIDIFMGVEREKALEWGIRKVEICFPPN